MSPALLVNVFLVGLLLSPPSSIASEMACYVDSDCQSGHSCRSKPYGGTRCVSRNDTHANPVTSSPSSIASEMACYVDSDCQSGHSCRSKPYGGTRCVSRDAISASPPTSVSTDNQVIRATISGGSGAREEIPRGQSAQGRRQAELEHVVEDGTPEHRVCSRYGFNPGTPNYVSCRQRIDEAKVQALRAQEKYEADLRSYNEQLARAQRDRDSDRNIRLMELGLGMIGGTQRSRRSASNIGPIPTPPSQNINVYLPNGAMVSCRSSHGVNVYCY
jgi:hypothetical protein